MVNHLEVLYTLRARAALLVVATTGTTSLASTASSYTRTAGSFVADGFKRGMEIEPQGFGHTGPVIVTRVTALEMNVDGTLPVEAEAAGRALVMGLPRMRAYENVGFELQDGRWGVDEDYLPGPTTGVTLGKDAELDHEPSYVLKLYGVAGYGPEGLYRAADELLRLFKPNAVLTTADGTVVRVRGDAAPFRGQLVSGGAGHALVVITIPLWVRTANIT